MRPFKDWTPQYALVHGACCGLALGLLMCFVVGVMGVGR